MSENIPFFVAVAAGMIRCATPVLLATIGECVTEKAGIFNLGLEGIMLSGALTAVVVSFNTQSPLLALFAATAVGLLLGLLHALICIKFQANQVASGIAMTIFLGGVTAFFGANYVGKSIPSISQIKVPGLGDLPVVGQIFFNHDPLVYFCYVMVPLTYWLINHTRFGLSMRAVGVDPRSAAASGINVRQVRYLATMLGAALAALGGAYLSLVYAQGWIENIVAGRGWIAVGLVIFATWNPWKALVGAYLFGLAVSLQLRLQAAGSDISPYLLGMLPYLLVIAVMAITAILAKGKSQGQPTALGIPYTEQS
jgi:simple sugar transport system permease protein